ncbi:MAG: SulP family [Verrucomicrobia bacterium]|nr:MAG: SulP family [Verrucomicrobiota bacterium]
MLVALPSSVAFGILVYSSLGVEYSGRGAMAGLLGAAALGLITPFIGRNPGLISAPCAPAAAVLAALVSELLAGKEGAPLDASGILPILAWTTLLSSLLQILYGALGGGKLIKFIPYQVVSGYLSSVGLIIALGQLPKLFGFPKGTPLFSGLFTPSLWKWESLAVGVVTIALTLLAPRVTKRIPPAICGLFGGVAAYFALSFFLPSLLRLEGNPLVIGAIQANGSVLEQVNAQLSSLFHVEWTTLKLVFVPALTLSILLSIDTLKTCVGLDALTQSRHQPNRELIGQGIGNLASFFVGGMPGAGMMGPTLVNVTSGGRTPRAGVLEGGFVLLALLLLGKWIAWVPIGALAGILLVIAWRMFDRNVFKLLLHPLGRIDFAVIASVVVVALSVDLIAASGVGIALAMLLFIRDQIHTGVIFHKYELGQLSSKTRRAQVEREWLLKKGGDGLICLLQGNLFFGTTDQLYSQLDKDIQNKRFLLMDLRRVRSIDYTAAHLFEQIHTRLQQRNGNLMFCGMPSGAFVQVQFERYLEELGLLEKGNGILVWDTLDEGLEWMEEQMLLSSGLSRSSRQTLLALPEFNLFREFDEPTLVAIGSCVSELFVEAGQKVFSCGDSGDEVFFVRGGSVRILMPLSAGKHHHLTTVSKGGIFGQMGFLDRELRTVDAEAKEPVHLYALSRQKFNERSRSNAAVGAQVFARLALATAHRLRSVDEELRLLQER